jgi:hypothetical protein
MKEFNNWFKDHVAASNVPNDDIKKLAASPIFTVMTYQAYDINGYTFYIIQQDKKNIYQNNWVRIEAYDNNMQKAPYYGQIEEIWELDYLEFKVALFKCQWVQGSQGVTRDKNGFVTVDLRNVEYKTEPFVLAKDVLHVFYVPDTVSTMRHIVLPSKRKIVEVHNAVVEEFNQFDEIPPFATCELPRLNANDKTPYLRTDHNEKIRVRSNSGRGRGRGRGRQET